MGLEVQIAVSKVSKYAARESGDTVEMIERPRGGLSLVLADGQRSGRSAKAISNLAVRKTISMLGEGVRDGAAARAAHDYLRTLRGGQVSATLNIVSIDLDTRTIVLSRNSPCPVVVITEEGMQILDEPTEPIGIYPRTKPVITELPLVAPTTVIVFTDGVLHAGQPSGGEADARQIVEKALATGAHDAHSLADTILAQAVARDKGRPRDDISVLVLTVTRRADGDEVRRMTVTFPITPAMLV